MDTAIAKCQVHGKKQFSLRSVRSDTGELSSLFMKNLEVIEWAE